MPENRKLNYCAPCWREYSKDWRKANPEKVKEHNLNWRKANPEKVKQGIGRRNAKDYIAGKLPGFMFS